MEQYTPELAPRFNELLSRREAELRELIRTAGMSHGDGGGDGAHDVMDFKDLAGEAAQATVDNAQADHAAQELGQVLAAQRRVAAGAYGHCLDCGDPIDLRRLLALPATPYCTACKDIGEQARASAERR